MVSDIRPVTLGSLVQILMWAMGVVCCVLVHIFSVHAPSLKRVPTIAGNEPVMDLCSFQAGVSNNQLLSTTNYVLYKLQPAILSFLSWKGFNYF